MSYKTGLLDVDSFGYCQPQSRGVKSSLPRILVQLKTRREMHMQRRKEVAEDSTALSFRHDTRFVKEGCM